MSPLGLSSRTIIVGIMDRDGFITLQRSTGGMTACRVPRTLVPYYVLWRIIVLIAFMDCYRNFWVRSLNVERDRKSVSASREILSSGDDGKCHEYLRMKSTRVRFYSQNCSSRPLEKRTHFHTQRTQKDTHNDIISDFAQIKARKKSM